MSYTPTEWKTGDVITAEKLNNMETGIAGAGSTFILYVISTDPAQTHLSMKMGDIAALLQNGKFPLLVTKNTTSNETNYTFSYCNNVSVANDGEGYVSCTIEGTQLDFEANSADEYPTIATP